jgi:hypothetical protein
MWDWVEINPDWKDFGNNTDSDMPSNRRCLCLLLLVADSDLIHRVGHKSYTLDSRLLMYETTKLRLIVSSQLIEKTFLSKVFRTKFWCTTLSSENGVSPMKIPAGWYRHLCVSILISATWTPIGLPSFACTPQPFSIEWLWMVGNHLSIPVLAGSSSLSLSLSRLTFFS